jgi:hypothetical protein
MTKIEQINKIGQPTFVLETRLKLELHFLQLQFSCDWVVSYFH